MTRHGHVRVSGRARPLEALSDGQWHCQTGSSLAELLVCLLVSATTLGLALPSVGWSARDMRARGAARLVASLLAQARLEAVRRGAHVAVEFLGSAPDSGMRLVIDANANGVRRAEVDAGIDEELQPAVSVAHQFRGVGFVIGVACPGIDGGPGLVTGDDPIRVGSSSLLVFTPEGTSSGGTVYLTGETGELLAVRVLGTTGRVRVLRCAATLGGWGEL